MSYSKELSGVLIRYLMFTCSEEIVGLVGHETSLASVLAVLNVLLSSVDCAHALIIEGKGFTKLLSLQLYNHYHTLRFLTYFLLKFTSVII